MLRTEVPSTELDPARDRRASVATQVVATVLGGVAVCFGIAIAVGVLRTFVALVGLAHPDLGWGAFAFDDAVQVFLGHTLYQDPADGYTGLLYPPLYPTLVGGLLHVEFWAGWGVVVSMTAGLSLVAMTARVAYRPSAAFDVKPVRIAEAAAIGLVGWWLVSIIPIQVAVDTRPEMLSWALAIGGLLLVPSALTGGRSRALAGPVLLISAAFWTKQPALAAGLAAGTFAVAMALLRAAAWRRTLVFIGALATVNLAVLGLLSLITHGWLYFLVFQLGRRHFWGVAPYGQIVRHELGILWVPALFALLALAAGALALWRRRTTTPRLRVLAAHPEAQRFLLLVLFVVIVAPMETYFQRKQGAESEHLVGIAWALILLAAVGYRWAGRDRRLAIVPLAAVALMGAVGLADGTQVDDNTGHVPRITDVRRFTEVPPAFLQAAAQQPIYDARWSDLGRRDGTMTTNYTACDLVAAGVHPGALERTLLDRTYPVVSSFPETDSFYCSGYGKWEDNYFWKLNRVIDRGYTVAPGTPPGTLLQRRREAVDTSDLRSCFAPFALGGALFRIGRGGGFWCRPSEKAQRLVLRDTPAPYSETLTDGTVTSISGTLIVTLPRGAGSVTVSAARPGNVTPLAKLDGAGGARKASLSLTFGGAAGTPAAGAVSAIDPAALKGARLVLAATQGSGATFDLGQVRIRTKGGYEVGKARRGLG